MTYDQLTERKSLLDRFRPMPNELVQNLDEWFRIELTYTSNAIEGNTLSRQETALIVEKGITVGGKSLSEHLEATNHANALDWVKDRVGESNRTIDANDILNIHKIILKSIDDENAGIYRNVPVRISGSTVILPNPIKVPQLMEEFADWLKDSKTLHPVEIATEAHYRLVTIHPFTDGNGRTARLLMNMLLLMHGYPMAIIRKEDRLKYLSSLEKSQLGGSKDDFTKLITRSIDRSFNIYTKALQGTSDNTDIEQSLLKIGQLSKRVGERHSTLRHWTKEGLLEVSEMTKSGYQLYSHDMINRVKRIRELQDKRYTLEEIKVKLEV